MSSRRERTQRTERPDFLAPAAAIYKKFTITKNKKITLDKRNNIQHGMGMRNNDNAWLDHKVVQNSVKIIAANSSEI